VYGTQSVRDLAVKRAVTLTADVECDGTLAAHAVLAGDDTDVESGVAQRHPGHRQATDVRRGRSSGAVTATTRRHRRPSDVARHEQRVDVSVVTERDRRVESSRLTGHVHALQPLKHHNSQSALSLSSVGACTLLAARVLLFVLASAGFNGLQLDYASIWTVLMFLGPFHGAIAVPSVTRCRCRSCCRWRCHGHLCAGGVRP